MYSYHIHSTFCHGENTPEEIVFAAIEQGMVSIGLSSHGYTRFDLRYCMQDAEGYIAEIRRLKEKYQDKIQIYLGVEEDISAPVDRSQFDYVIGSAHWVGNADPYFEEFWDCDDPFLKYLLGVREYVLLHDDFEGCHF
jgi:histidinol-phosphatase (PHP family)